MEKPPAPEPIGDPEDGTPEAVDRPDRHEAQKAFWTKLLAQANERSDLHSGISATRDNWVGSRRHGHSWNYVLLQDATRAELYVDTPVAADNKALFDALHAQCSAIESEFGGALTWQRLDDKRACRISFSVPGGWVDETAWPAAIERGIDAMQRLYGALSPRVAAVGKVSKGAV